MSSSVASDPSQVTKVLKKSQTQNKGFLSHLKGKISGKEHEQAPEVTRTPGNFQPPPAQTPPRKHSIPTHQQPVSTKIQSPKSEEDIKILNKEAGDIERSWSIDVVGNKNGNQQPQGTMQPNAMHGKAAVSRKPMNGHIPAKETNYLSLAKVSLSNAPLTALRHPDHTYAIEPHHFSERSSTLEQTDITSELYHQKEPHARPESSDMTRSQSQELLQREKNVLKQKNQKVQEDPDTTEEKANQVHSQEMEVEALRLTLAQDRENLRILQEERDRAASDVTQLTEENVKLQEDVMTWRNQFNLVNDALIKLQVDLTSASKVDDKYFVGQWREIHVNIESLSLQYFLSRSSRPFNSMLDRVKGSRPDKSESQPVKAITQLAESYTRYLKSEQDRPIIIQSFIWSTLVNKIFNHKGCYDGGFFWAGQSRALLCHLSDEIKPIRPRRQKDYAPLTPSDIKRLKEETRTFHKWRAETAIMMLAREPVGKRIRNINSEIGALITEIFEAMAPYILTDKDKSATVAEFDIKEQLRIIVTKAIETDAEMAKQRAWIFCEQWRAEMDGDPCWGFRPKSEDTDIVTSPEQSKSGARLPVDPFVEIIVQPALFRKGNQYGEEYEHRHVLCKAKVIVSENPASPISRR
jgi:hypothetical protein